jgi:hypothetical protein
MLQWGTFGMLQWGTFGMFDAVVGKARNVGDQFPSKGIYTTRVVPYLQLVQYASFGYSSDIHVGCKKMFCGSLFYITLV